MSKYIDAEKLKRHYAWWDDETKKVFDEIIDLQPAADVVEVVRCKDCVNWKDTFPYSTCELLSGHWEEDMYCSYGERKDG